MRLLILSRAFRPGVGGLETMMEMIADAAVAEGHEVIVGTLAVGEGGDDGAYRVVRQPSVASLCRLIAWADVVLHGGLSLRWLWPSVFIPTPVVVSHHVWYVDPRGGLQLTGRIKRIASRFVTNIAASEALAKQLKAPATLIPNCYRDEVFHDRPLIARNRDLIFVGRLVSDKGVDDLLDALGSLRREGIQPALTVVGDGPERARLEARAAAEGLSSQVRFLGILKGNDLGNVLCAHRILVVPSVWAEPFGIVALEAIACGCVIVGSRDGGLSEAIGPCGVTYPNGDAVALAQRLREMLAAEPSLDEWRRHASSHLEKHRKSRIAARYLQVCGRFAVVP